MLNSRRVFTRNDFLIASGILRQRPLGDISYGRRKQEVFCEICETTVHRYVTTSRRRSPSDVWWKSWDFSVRRAARALGLLRCMVHRILWRNNLRPYHYQRVQQLLERDEAPRVHFCEGIYLFFLLDNHNTFLQRLNINKIFIDVSGLLAQHRRNASFLDYVLWSDEATFTPNGVFNSRNYLTWHFENPYAIRGRLSI